MKADPFKLLGLESDASPAQVRLAYMSKAKTSHPDRGGDPEDHIALTRAYQLATRLARETPCPECGGRGTIRSTNGFFTTSIPCDICLGTGKMHNQP